MKSIAILSAANNIHTIRWANGLAGKGCRVHVLSLHKPSSDTIAFFPEVTIHVLAPSPFLGYFFAYRELKKILVKIRPEILNAHYATGYGLLARLSGFHPLLLSVWGSDVYNFPTYSVFHRFFLKENLKNADALASTSHCMAREIKKNYDHSHVFITSFGVDEQKFFPFPKNEKKKNVHIGTVKTLSENYGIDILLQAFALVRRKCTVDIYLSIAGKGKDEEELRLLAQKLGIADTVNFLGFISHDQVPFVLNSLDIYVALSRKESFGVAVLEASACGKPVVVSDAEGLEEVVENGKTGFVVGKDDPLAAADALLRLIEDPSLRCEMGENGRQRVLKYYTWEHSLNQMLQAYEKTIALVKKDFALVEK